MRALLLDRFGDPSNFRQAELPRPEPIPGHALVRIQACSVNPADYKIRQAGPPIAPELPAVLGMDFAGTIEALGDGVEGFRPGDEVYGCAGGVRGVPGGALAEYMLADVRLIARKPAALSMREAAALPLVSITAWEALHDRAGLAPGQSVLIHGGAGGVGHVAIQLAKARGAAVFATVSSDAKAEVARRLGADSTIDYRTEPVEDYVARLTEGKGFDVVFDATGGDDLATSFAAARLNGQVVTIVSQYSADLSPMHAKGLTLHVVFMLIPMLHDVGRAHHGQILGQVAALAEAGDLRPLLDPRRFSLAEAPEAHRHLEGGQARGKVVIDVAAG